MQSYQDMANQLAGLIERQLKMSEAALPVLLRRIGRRAPKRVRRDLRQVAEAAQLGQHPKLAARIDADGVQAAYTRATVWLKDVDWDAQRAQARRAIWATIAFNLMLLAAVVVCVLTWGGAIGPSAGVNPAASGADPAVERAP